MIREEMVRMEEQDSPPSSLSSRHSHEDDEDKMPEEAFMKYTKDSRAGSPAPSATAKVQQASSTPFLTSLIGGEGGSRGEDTDQGGPQGIAGFWSRCPWDRRGLLSSQSRKLIRVYLTSDYSTIQLSFESFRGEI